MSAVLRSELRAGTYRDSILLMQLQRALAELPGVLDAGALMGTPENLALLEAGGLLPELSAALRADDLLVVVRAVSEEAAAAALSRVDGLLARTGGSAAEDFRPRTLAAAAKLLPEARWVAISVPGRFAGGLAREALESGRHVFLYSDNVPLAEEVRLKRLARERGLLVMGPDCGTALVNGVGFGFANRVRRGSVGLVSASGTGLQAVSVYLHRLGAGVSHGIGTGGRDLRDEVEGTAALQALDLLGRDAGTEVIVLISKPPGGRVADRILRAAEGTGKPVVARFLGHPASAARQGPVRFAGSLGEAAEMAAALLPAGSLAPPTGTSGTAPPADPPADSPGDALPAARGTAGGRPSGGYVRGLFAGGTLALEALGALRDAIGPLHSNVALEGVEPAEETARSRGHTVLDLGADEFTVGRPHPVIDNDLRVRRILQEARDPEAGILLFDVVLGEGAHPDPAGELAAAVEEVRPESRAEFVAILIGTADDPQDLEAQERRLTEAGVRVFRDPVRAARHVARRLGGAGIAAPASAPARGPAGQGRGAGWAEAPPETSAREVGPAEHAPLPEAAPQPEAAPPAEAAPPVPLEDLNAPVAVIDVGLDLFHESLLAQGARALRVEWRPPAGGDQRLMEILERMRD